ncbi:hypothetical protein F9278_43125 [Streptomyces phaeolivaceus]|uniref:Uncharacterized protein n=1 Tax=Streptomyces phaeolivaceus TaxID=2653200 RepID=A0A5P8KH30_9ACTN|nr:hypothetical protein [Streptomyces phaeolivaceus]QFR01850.1 hypothetical protein F9278_43125 [Streptomyces phaeolivaceus]
MTDHRLEGPGEHADPVPRDLPDQQAHEGEDPWEVTPRHATGDDRDENGGDPPDEATDTPDTDVPDTDEAGTGRQGAPRSGAVNPEQPVPDEPSG